VTRQAQTLSRQLRMCRDKFRYSQDSSDSVETSLDIVKTVQNVLRQAHILL